MRLIANVKACQLSKVSTKLQKLLTVTIIPDMRTSQLVASVLVMAEYTPWSLTSHLSIARQCNPSLTRSLNLQIKSESTLFYSLSNHLAFCFLSSVSSWPFFNHFTLANVSSVEVCKRRLFLSTRLIF